MTLHLSLALLFNGVLAATCLFAFIRGGRPERIGAAINLAASALSTVLRLMDHSYFAPTSVVMFAIDLTVVAGFFWLATTTTRYWPIWALGFALADFILSVAGSLLAKVPLFAFHSGLGLYAYLALGAMTLGTIGIRPDATSDERAGRRNSAQCGGMESG